ncbi:hypothetical protein [Gallionella capsiferriformans]|uniref:Uncharacterized protein n=1 Tax=Gallionella capsiferriformans (strain ES-2) TaxID=395494 RepID=D9SJV1_GALCS|nr:hypothetical protein [Gallionella capsiferriformans]ADL54450.1 hypothetical protein Galf_0406 [Gallionella capsiferriformans ES-2]
MTLALRVNKLLAGMLLALLAGTGSAAELDLSLPASTYRPDTKFMGESTAEKTEADKDAQKFEPDLLSGSKLHQYLGVGTMVMAGMTFITHKHPVPGSNAPRDMSGAHARYAKATVAMAAATVATGLLTHWDDFSLEDGWSDPDNLHVLLALSGAALMAYAVNKSMHSSTPTSHAGMAELGAVGMGLAIKLTW